MKIYFAGSIRGGRDDANLYFQIITHLKKYGTVLTEHVGNMGISSKGKNHHSETYIHDRDMQWLNESDLIVAEVTNPSLGVGYELGRAIEKNKKIICLHRKSSEKKLSAMIAGSDKMDVFEYKEMNDVKSILDSFFEIFRI